MRKEEIERHPDKSVICQQTIISSFALGHRFHASPRIISELHRCDDLQLPLPYSDAEPGLPIHFVDQWIMLMQRKKANKVSAFACGGKLGFNPRTPKPYWLPIYQRPRIDKQIILGNIDAAQELYIKILVAFRSAVARVCPLRRASRYKIGIQNRFVLN